MEKVIPQDILDDAHIKYPIKRILEKSFPGGVDMNTGKRNIYIEARMEERAKRWTDEDMLNVWNQAAGKTWDDENGYYSPEFEEWIAEYKKSKTDESI